LRLGRAARKQLAKLIAGATSLQGDFFRSVAFRYFHPDDVISGEGTRLHGGRFVPVGVRAVYASLEEETALREVTSRKSALGGRSGISVGEYPRMTYVLSVATQRNLDLAATLSSELAILAVCLKVCRPQTLKSAVMPVTTASHEGRERVAETASGKGFGTTGTRTMARSIAARIISACGWTYRFVMAMSRCPARWASVQGSMCGAQRVRHVWRSVYSGKG
jgi:hypothetical protein